MSKEIGMAYEYPNKRLILIIILKWKLESQWLVLGWLTKIIMPNEILLIKYGYSIGNKKKKIQNFWMESNLAILKTCKLFDLTMQVIRIYLEIMHKQIYIFVLWTGDWHLPSASTQIQSGATAAAGSQHPEWSSGWRSGVRHPVRWERWQNRSSES